MARLTLALFGSFQASLDGKPLTNFRSARIQALLTYLVLEAERAHTRDTLAALLWPDEPDPTAKQNLRQALYQLRQLLGEQTQPAADPFLWVTRETVQFNPASDYALDVAEFLQTLQQGDLQAAVARYPAELLTGLTSGSDRFEEWLILQREHLHILALNALRQLTEQGLTQADDLQAQHYARRQLAFEPWREEAHRQLMLALARSGDRGAALAQYETCRRLLSEEFGIEPDAATLALVAKIRTGDLRNDSESLVPSGIETASEEQSTTPHPAAVNPQSKIDPVIDWGEAPDIGAFYGRTSEVTQLRNWMLGQGCRLIAVLGMGGMGKTTLAAQVVRQCTAPGVDYFSSVIWRSLLNAPTLSDLLDQWLRILSGQRLAQIPSGLDAQLRLLLDYLRAQRCLLILDNVESIMQGGERAGYYRTGYENYGQLLLRIGQSSHQSCLLITSREQPREIGRLAAETPFVRALPLAGLDAEGAGELLDAQGLRGPGSRLATLVGHYSGNPLALKLVAEAVQDIFDGDLDAFLGDAAPIFDDIRDVLDQQFGRLSAVEQALLFWLASAREPLTESQLWHIFARTTAKRGFLEALRSLLNRSLVENYGGAFRLQNVVTDYLTDYFVTQIAQEFATATPTLLHSHALILAHAKEYVRQSQVRMILQPISERLLASYDRTEVEARCQQLLTTMQHEQPLQPSFLAGNLLNLLVHLGSDLRGYDFSNLSVWQAYLRGADLPALDFTHADLTDSVFTDYAGAVTAVAFSPDGQRLAAGADSGVIYLWRVTDRQLIGLCQGHTSHVWSLAFSPTSQQLLSGSGDATVRLWDVESRQPLHKLTGHAAGVSTVAFHPNGSIVASGSLDRMVYLWDAQTGQLLQSLEADGTKVEAVAFSPDGALLATGGHDQVVSVWDWERGQILQTLRGHRNLIKVVGFCPHPLMLDGTARTLLVSGGDDQRLRLWDVSRGELLGDLVGHSAAVVSLAFSANGVWLLSGSDDQTIRIWDLQRQQTLRILHGHYGTVRSLAVHPHPAPGQALLASGSYDKTVRLWEMQGGQPLAVLRGHSKWLQALVFTVNAQGASRLRVSGSDGQNVRVWDGYTGRVLHTLRGHTSLTEKISFRSDGAQLASASWDQTARIWDLQSSQPRHILQGHRGAVATAVIGPGPHGRRLIASGGLDHTVRIWDGETGQALAVWHGHHDRVVGLAFRPDGALLASGAWDSSIGLWDTANNELRTFLRGHTETVESVAFHPGGNLLASASWDRSVRLWDVGSAAGVGQLLHVLQAHTDGLEMVVFSPDGALLASCACDQLVCVWDVQAGRLLYKLQGHTSWVRCIAFSLDSKLLASGSDDGTVKLWDVTLEGAGACRQTIFMEDPYTGMNITGATGIGAAQKAALQALGAVEMPALPHLGFTG